MTTPITFRLKPILSILVASLALAASGCTDESACTDGEKRDCYTGPESTSGKGNCKAGKQTCSGGQWLEKCEGMVIPTSEICDGKDNDCDGTSDEEVKNPCGGCAALDGAPGSACGECGTLACDGSDALVCQPPAGKVPGTGCKSGEGCDGTWKCGTDGKVTCDAPKKNACGKCGGGAVTGIGEECTSTAGCEGQMACDETGEAVACNAPAKNNCGTCGAPEVTGLGETCMAGSCQGKKVCNASGTGTSCNAAGANECGVCGGPAVTQIGQDCALNGCVGKYVCNTAGDGAVCNAPEKNNCGACGKPNVTGLDGNCTAANSCPGKYICNTAGDGKDCFSALLKNECGVCTAEPLPDHGKQCTVASCSGGTWQCDAAGTALVCSSRPNNCGVCDVPDVAGVGDACTGTSGCPGKLVCNASKDGTVCEAPASCAATDHVVISEIATEGPAGASDEFIELYNPTSQEVSLSGWMLWYASALGSPQATQSFAFKSTAKIPPHGFYLVTQSASYKGTPAGDETFDFATAQAGGSVWLTSVGSSAPSSTTEARVVDVVAWGTSKSGNAEGGHPAPASAKPGSLERKAFAASTADSMATGADAAKGNGYDSDDNLADFVERATRGPQNSSSAAEQ